LKIPAVFQTYKIHLINGEVLEFWEDYDIPAEKGICGKFEKSDEKDVLCFGNSAVDYYVPKRSILFITAGDVMDMRAKYGVD